MTTIHKLGDWWNWNYRCALPETLTIVLKGPTKEIDLSNIYCSYWISVGGDDCFSEHQIISNQNEEFILPRQRLIKKTGMEPYYDGSLPLDNFPIKFDFEVLSADKLAQEIKFLEYHASGAYVMEVKNRDYPKYIKEEIKDMSMRLAKELMEESKEKLPIIRQNRNQVLCLKENENTIIDHWTEERDYYYELSLQL